MKPRVGKCPVCGRRVGVHDSREVRNTIGAVPRLIRSDERRIVISWHREGGGDCPGSYMEPAPDSELDKRRYNAERKRQRDRLALIAPFRQHAGVALDAAIDGHPYPRTELVILLRVAVVDYMTHYAQPVTYGPLRYVPRLGKGYAKTARGDLYCSFCGEFRTRNVAGDLYGMTRANLLRRALQDGHAIRCALEHLTHGHQPQPPTMRRLPPEYLVDEQQEAGA